MRVKMICEIWFLFFKQKTAYEMRISDWSSDVCSSDLLGAAGYVGMTLPARYGGGDRHPLERYVVIEELLAAGAPVGAHWIADRQTGPLILRYGSEEQRERYLPGIAKGELYACIDRKSTRLNSSH